MTVISQLDEWLQENRPEYYGQLLPGLTDAEYERFTDQVGLELPLQFKALYQWKNGQNDHDLQSFFYTYEFMNSHQIIFMYSQLNDYLASGEFPLRNWWNSKWLPFLSDHCGNYFCIDMEGSFNGTPGQIIEFDHESSLRIIHNNSLENFLQTVLGACLRGFNVIDNYFAYDTLKSGFSVIHDSVDYDILKKEGYLEFFKSLNPGYPIIEFAE